MNMNEEESKVLASVVCFTLDSSSLSYSFFCLSILFDILISQQSPKLMSYFIALKL